MGSELKPITCKCGSQTFLENTRVIGGWWQRTIYFDYAPDELQVEANIDGIRLAPAPKTVLCDECGKRHPNPRLTTGS